MTESIEEQLNRLGINYGYFWNPILDQEPEEDRLNREEFVKQLLTLIAQEKDKHAAYVIGSDNSKVSAGAGRFYINDNDPIENSLRYKQRKRAGLAESKEKK